jgi:phosphoglycerate dehydrogenase-like enzyme
VDILVSEHGAARLAHARLQTTDRLLQLTPDGRLRLGARSVGLDDAHLEAAWLTPDVLMAGRSTESFIDLVLATGTVKWVQSAAAGTDIAGFDRLAQAGVRVCNSDANAISVAEFVFAHVLEHYQGLEQRRLLQHARSWAQHEFKEIFATTWLVVGLGAVGSAVAGRAQSFGATVLGVRRTASGAEPVDELMHPGELLRHIGRADVIVLALPATRETVHLVDSQFLARLRDGAVMLNVARGSIVDEAALLECLDDGRPELAVLDTVASEPLPADSPLWSHPRVRITCHGAALGTGRLARGTDQFVENLARYRSGLPLISEVPASMLS